MVTGLVQQSHSRDLRILGLPQPKANLITNPKLAKWHN